MQRQYSPEQLAAFCRQLGRQTGGDKSKADNWFDAFSRLDGRDLMLAAISDGRSFAILTTAANASVAPVHARMPLVLENTGAWLAENGGFVDLLRSRPAELRGIAKVKSRSLLDL